MEKQIPQQRLKNLQTAVRPGNKDMQATWRVKLPLVFSYINSTLLLVYGLSGVLFRQSIVSFLQSDNLPQYFYFWRENLIFFYEANIFYYILLALLSSLLLYACTLIWNGHRTGVNLYAFGRASILLLPILFFSLRGVAVGDIMLGCLFITYYYLYMFRNPISPAPTTEKEHPLSESE